MIIAQAIAFRVCSFVYAKGIWPLTTSNEAFLAATTVSERCTSVLARILILVYINLRMNCYFDVLPRVLNTVDGKFVVPFFT